MSIRGWTRALGAIAVLAAMLAAFGSASNGISSAKCGNPKVEPLGTPLAGNRGYIGCSDGATAIVKYKGKTYKLGFKPKASGVCWKDSTAPLYVDVGANVNPPRLKSDPPGVSLALVSPGSIFPAQIDFGVSQAVKWIGPVVVTKTGKLSGTFKDATLVSGQKWKASGKIVTGSYSCKRVLVVPG
jgi:hypothetical protein